MTEVEGIIRIETPLSVDHVMTREGWFGLEIAQVFQGDSKPTILRVTLTKDRLLALLAQIEATRQQFDFPLPAVFSQQQTRQ
ncbi:MAG TPA: hypothetical protein VK804_02760 [Bradyrhizobium sp.]|uniref:hypothetical protein n=1 Tax=Bradyrhizobium sp. TaxID=376 RepID=UPI002C591FEB|nr:hypothetical protein [Bradyrhizobium sp.]HTA99371.1 hypothetical protein [Bradyrhizobium sp.]